MSQPRPSPSGSGGRRNFLPRSTTGWFAVVAVAWGAVVTVLGVAHVLITPVAEPENRPIAALDADYVSSVTCRSCHPGNYNSWHTSYHRRMTQVASVDTVATDITGFTGELAGRAYRVFREGDDYFMQERPVDGPAHAWEPSRQIVLLTGSHNLQMFWVATEHGRALEQFPFAYIIGDDRWAPAHDTFLLPPHFAQGMHETSSVGEWNQACMDCHTTFGRPKFVEGFAFDSRVAEFGISCEACHGDGAEHIAANRNPLRRYLMHLNGSGDTTMVDPADLPGPESTLACGQCHSVWGFKTLEDTLAEAARDDLHTFNPNYFDNRFWKDGMVRVTGREMNGVVKSPCFEGGSYSCLSCHEMHPAERAPAVLAAWKSDQLRTDHGGTNQDCLQCHEAMGRDIAGHTFHAPDSPGSSCYDCHMPHTSYGLLRAVRSHQVSSPSVRESVETGRPNACNLCHLDETLAWTGEHLANWYGQAPPELSEDERAIAAAVLWVLKGDAGQRAVVTWNMSRPEAQAAAGRDWMYPLLTLNLNDSYSAVRYITHKALTGLPGFEGFEYDYTGDESVTRPRVTAAYEHWFNEVKPADAAFEAKHLLQPNGLFYRDELARLLGERDQRPVFLAE